MGAAEFEIKTISNLVDAANRALQLFKAVPWWRGHADNDWKLVPGVFRSKERADHEQLLAAEFMRQAPILYANSPSSGAWAEWLYLMQHYRLYTRLLDWTESPLVAAFFSVDELLDKPGTIWALHPGLLNKSQGRDESVPHFVGGSVDELFKEALLGRKPNEESARRILAVCPTSVDFRMQAQSSVFTIHGSSSSLEVMPDNGSFLLRFEIPAEAKVRLRRELALLGIKRSYLFPDLENLARFLNERGGVFK